MAALMRILLEDRKAREEQYEAQQAQMREKMERQRERDELEKNQMREQMEPSTSDWCAPIVPVKKKDGTLRLCVDYRRLNAVSESDAYTMPRMDDVIDRLGGVGYITGWEEWLH